MFGYHTDIFKSGYHTDIFNFLPKQGVLQNKTQLRKKKSHV